MTSPLRSERFSVTPTNSARALSLSTPGSRVSVSSFSDETIWKKLKMAGLDEESIKRRDKAALIAYIAKLEAEIFDHQHQMGLLILERKDWGSMYEQLKASAESSEIKQKIEQAAHLAALAEAKKREDSLKKALVVGKECIANIEKAMHEMRAEAAETKVAREMKQAEAHLMVEDAQKKLTEAQSKFHEAEYLQAEANRYHRSAERKLQEVEAREDDLRRRMLSFKSDCDAKVNEITLEKQSLSERQKILKEEQERLLDGQALLNQREDHLFSKSKNLNRFEIELDALKAEIEKERSALNEEKSNLNITLASLSAKEEDAIKREVMLDKKEQELLVLQEKFASKEIAEVKKIKDGHEIALKKRMSEFEAELEMKRKLVEDDLDAKRRSWELREVDLRHHEELVLEKEHDLGVQLRALADKENDMVEKLKILEEKEKNLDSSEKEVELKKVSLLKEQEEINNIKKDLLKSFSTLEDRSKQVDCAKENVDALKIETDEFLILETKLKEEIDMVRAEKLEVLARADELNLEKAKFESEWESIDEKREEFRKEAECIASEKQAISTFLKEERIHLKSERDVMREQYESDVESLCREREEFRSQMVHERSDWFNKIQQERTDFLLDLEMQKRELENRFEKTREELENDFRERERAFEEEKAKELVYISTLKDTVANDLEYVTSEMRKLKSERAEIKMDRERRDREWAEISNSIEELKIRRQKLTEQRELLHADRQDIHDQIEHLTKLKHLEVSLNNVVAVEPTQSKVSADGFLKQQDAVRNANLNSFNNEYDVENGSVFDLHSLQRSASGTPNISPVSWFKRCAKLIFRKSPDKSIEEHKEASLISENKNGSLKLVRKLDSSNGYADAKNENFSGPSKLIPEIPSSGQNGSYNLDSGIETDGKENPQSSSEQENLVSRKRRNSNPTNVLADILVDEGQVTKKRRHHADTTRNLSEETIARCVVSIQRNETGAVSTVHTEGISESDKTVVLNKIVEISEVMCMSTDVEKDVFHEMDPLQNSKAELYHDSLHSGGINGLFDSSYSNEQALAREQPTSVQYFTEQRESLEDAILDKLDEQIENYILEVPEEVEL